MAKEKGLRANAAPWEAGRKWLRDGARWREKKAEPRLSPTAPILCTGMGEAYTEEAAPASEKAAGPPAKKTKKMMDKRRIL